MKKRTKRLLAMLLAASMILQQGSTVGVLANETESATEMTTETTAAKTQAETQETEAKAPETQAPEMVQCEYCGGWFEAGNVFRNHVCPARDAAYAQN